jgi:hypothetical protein
MPIVLIQEDERLSHAVDESTFFYTRLPGNVRAQILHEHTHNGQLDFWQSRYTMGAAALSGWENVLGSDGQPVPFDKAKVRFIPGSIVFDIGLKVDELAPASFFGASLGSSSGSAPSEASAVEPVAAS